MPSDDALPSWTDEWVARNEYRVEVDPDGDVVVYNRQGPPAQFESLRLVEEANAAGWALASVADQCREYTFRPFEEVA